MTTSTLMRPSIILLFLCWTLNVHAESVVPSEAGFNGALKNLDASPSKQSLYAAKEKADECVWRKGDSGWQEVRDAKLSRYCRLAAIAFKHTDITLGEKMSTLSSEMTSLNVKEIEKADELYRGYKDIQARFDKQRPLELALEEVIFGIRFNLERHYKSPEEQATGLKIISQHVSDEVLMKLICRDEGA